MCLQIYEAKRAARDREREEQDAANEAAAAAAEAEAAARREAQAQQWAGTISTEETGTTEEIEERRQVHTVSLATSLGQYTCSEAAAAEHKPEATNQL